MKTSDPPNSPAPDSSGNDWADPVPLAERLAEIGRMANSHLISPTRFEKMVREIQERELTPRGRLCQVRTLGDGTIRFIIKEANRVCDMIESRTGGAQPSG